MAAVPGRHRLALVATVVLTATLVLSSTVHAATSYTVEVTPAGPFHVGDTITLTPVVSALAAGTPRRCFMWIERYDFPATWLRMQVSSDGCEPWTFTIPEAPIGQYAIHGGLFSGFSNGQPTTHVDAPDTVVDIADGGSPVPFSTNYPVQSWALDAMVSTSTPRYGEPLTINPPSGVGGCELRILGGGEQSFVDQKGGCQAWTFTIPPRDPQAPATMFGETSDVHITSWSGAGTYGDDRPDAGFLGAQWGETYNIGLEDFAPAIAPTTAYASNLPAVFAGINRLHTQLVGDPTVWDFVPVVVDATTGTCAYDVGLFPGETYSGPTTTPVVPGGCESSAPLPPYLGSGNAVRRASVALRNVDGTVVARTDGDFGYAVEMAPVVVDAPPAADSGQVIPIDASTDAGVPASYDVVAAPEAATAPATRAVADMTAPASGTVPLASGTFSPNLGTTGASIHVTGSLAAAGRYRITTTFTDVTGATSSGSTVVTIGTDAVAPTTTSPKNTFLAGGTVSSGKVPTHVTWSGSDVGSGIARYVAAISVDGAAYSTIYSTLTSPALTRYLAPGHYYRFRVQAVDKAGNVGNWSYGSTFTVSAYQESSTRFGWSGTWYRPTSTSYWGGYERYATGAGAKVSFSFTGRGLAWIGSVGPSRGSAKIYVNGVYLKTVSLYATTTAYRRVLVALSWSTAISRRITIVVVGTSGRPRVDLDAFVTAS
jgi:hypothetical protein